MVQSVLGSLILGYRPLWNRARKLAGIQLYAHNEASATVDGGHLLRTLQELWSASSPPLLISAQTRQLLCDLLENAPRAAPWIEVRGEWLSKQRAISGSGSLSMSPRHTMRNPRWCAAFTRS